MRELDGCTALCKLEEGVCGDGLTQTALGEQCDDGNKRTGDGCDLVCQLEPPPPSRGHACGDNVLDVDRGEQCDDGESNAETPSACRTNCTLPRCGDGIADFNEECDDGNQLAEDGCSGTCEVEPSQASIPGGVMGELTGVRPPRDTQTGPGLVIVLVSGAAAGIGIARRWGWRRRTGR